MKMDDEKLKRILQEGMDYEADCIMAEVNSDSNVKDVVAPEELHSNLMKQIKEHEAEVERERQNQSKEEEELIRLGKIYKKKRSRRKYIVLIAAVVCALAVGTISLGDGKKVFTEIQSKIQDLKYTRISTKGEGRIAAGEGMKEEEAFQQIKDAFGFWIVKMYYLPEGMNFDEIIIEEDIQSARLYYKDEAANSILYYVTTNYRHSSIGIEVEDKLTQEYEEHIGETIVNIQEYLVEDNQTKRWVVSFVYKDAQYSIMMIGIEKEEVNKIIDNLYFL